MVALITGGGKGIGFKTAELFRNNGYKVIITGRNEKKLIDATERLGEILASDGGRSLFLWKKTEIFLIYSIFRSTTDRE